jgi:hypothetical protein
MVSCSEKGSSMLVTFLLSFTMLSATQSGGWIGNNVPYSAASISVFGLYDTPHILLEDYHFSLVLQTMLLSFILNGPKKLYRPPNVAVTFIDLLETSYVSLEYSTLLRIIMLNINQRKCQYTATVYVYIYIVINFIRLHVSTRIEWSSYHLNLFLWSNSYYKWNVSPWANILFVITFWSNQQV